MKSYFLIYFFGPVCTLENTNLVREAVLQLCECLSRGLRWGWARRATSCWGRRRRRGQRGGATWGRRRRSFGAQGNLHSCRVQTVTVSLGCVPVSA